MNIEARLGEILTALDNASAVYLVMGGHAARGSATRRCQLVCRGNNPFRSRPQEKASCDDGRRLSIVWE
jgi:hypothetical protein